MSTKVMLVDERAARADWLGEALLEAGFLVVAKVDAGEDLYQRVLDLKPDVVIIDSRSGRRDILEGMCSRAQRYPRPVVLFTEHNHRPLLDAATRAGISAYVVDGLSAQGVQSIINVAINQFQQFEELRHRLADAQTRLADQRMLERAKCLLLERQGLSENQAYQVLRRAAMDTSRPLAQVARTLLKAHGAG
jgi:two-component system, response regulator / RNA-binding antiterminator